MRSPIFILAAVLAAGCTDDPPVDIAVDLPGGVSVVRLAVAEGSSPANHTVTVTNNGTTDMSVTITNFESVGGNWLATSTSTLTVVKQTSGTFDLVFSMSALPPGLYTATVKLDAVSTPGGKRAVGSPLAFRVNVVVTRSVAVLETGTSSVEIDVPTPVGWDPTSATGAPLGRVEHTLTYVGGEFLVFGGSEFAYMTGPAANGGAFYDPDADTWRTMADATGGDERAGHGAIWDRTNDRVIIYGGHYDSMTFISDPNSVVMTYDLDADNTSPWSTSPYSSSGLDARKWHVMADVGTSWIAWGGIAPKAGGGEETVNTGWVCDFTSACTAMSTTGAPSARFGALGVWTGRELIAFGGTDSDGEPLHDGGRFDPVTNVWTTMNPSHGPTANPGQYGGTWTGSELLVFGGVRKSGATWERMNELWAYDPVSDHWRELDSSDPDTPGARSHHTAVWTGSRLVVFGGYDGLSPVSSGGQYDPAANAWLPMPYDDEPAARWLHASAWSGTRMFTWGGNTGGGFTSTGAVLE